MPHAYTEDQLVEQPPSGCSQSLPGRQFWRYHRHNTTTPQHHNTTTTPPVVGNGWKDFSECVHFIRR